MILTQNINLIQASLLVEECFRNGADTFFLSPGARCSPLTYAVARHPEVRSVLHFDERGLAFAALGYARATGRPGVVITTSGSAVSNLHPAVTEARMDGVPMLLLTADRPPELRDCGANQAIHQVNHFGQQCVWFFDLPCPSTTYPPTLLLTTLDQALLRTRRGPVHLNCQYREPLGAQPDRVDAEAYLAPLHQWSRHRAPYTTHGVSDYDLDELNAVELDDLISSAGNIAVIAGGGLTESEALAIDQLAARRGWPVLSDVTSGLHFGPHRHGVVRHVDALIANSSFPEALQPDAVLQFGHRFLSKRLAQALANTPLRAWIQITPREGRFDPLHRVTHRFCAEIDRACLQLERVTSGPANPAFREPWLRADQHVAAVYREHLKQSQTLTEPGVAYAISRWLPNSHGLVLGASMPVRDMNQFAAANPHRIHVAANRGASGIDGTLATATGFARGLHQPVTVVLGDLACLHDLNSLALLSRERDPVIVIVINNKGGGIFHFLPLSDGSKEFETFWGTPHHWEFQHAADQFHLPYAKPRTMEEFIDTYRDALEQGHSCLIEVETDRNRNVEHHLAMAELLRESRSA